MSDSISKLAVIITGDTAPLSSAMQKAMRDVDIFAAMTAQRAREGADAWNAGLARMKEAAEAAKNPFEQLNLGARKMAGGFDSATASGVKLSTMLGAFRGNLNAAFLVGGPAALGIAAMVLGVKKLADAGDDLLVRLGEDKLNTWAGQWERLNEQLGIAGMNFAAIAAEATAGLAETLASINEALFPESVAHADALKARQAAEKQIEESKKKQNDENEKQLRLNKEAAEAQERERDALLEFKQRFIDRGDDIRKSVLTPAEKLRETFLELRQLLSGGFIDEATAERAGQAAVDAIHKAKDEISRPDQGVGAVNRFTTAGFSAVQSGKRELERISELQRQEVEAAKRAEEQRRVMIEVLRGNQPVVILEGAPP